MKIMDGPFVDVNNAGRRISNSSAGFQTCYALFSFIGLAVVFIISLPAAIIIAVIIALLRQIWIAAEAGQHTHDRHMALTYLNDTLEERKQTVWKKIADPVFYGNVPDEIYTQPNFWIALAGVPVAQIAFDKARAQCMRRKIDSPNIPDEYETLKRKREGKKERSRSEIDFEYLNYTVEYVETGSRSTFALQVVTDYSINVVKIGPGQLLETFNSVATTLGGMAAFREYKRSKKTGADDTAGSETSQAEPVQSEVSGNQRRWRFWDIMREIRKELNTSHHSTTVDIRF